MRAVVLIGALACASAAQAYDLKNLSRADVLAIGQGLDELPRKMTSTADPKAPGLWDRIQAQIAATDGAINQATADAQKKAIGEYNSGVIFDFLDGRGWPAISSEPEYNREPP